MSEKKWTPGPWWVVNSCDNLIMGVDATDPKDGRVFELCEVWGEDDDKTITEMSEANAMLISAAPELYEALEEMLRIVGGYEYPETAKMARAALAKARGESK